MYQRARSVGLEGVVSKVRDSRHPAGRGHDWVKKTCAQREMLPIAGFALKAAKFDGIYLGRRCRTPMPGFTAFLHRLSRFARVVTFDKRGQGLSDHVSGVPLLEERMDDVRAVMDAIGSQRAVLLGFSEGSPMSVLFAATYPECVSHLVLVGGFARAWGSDDAFEVFVRATVAAWGTGQSMKRVIGTHDGNEREIALLGKYERLSCSPGAFKTLMLMNRRIDITSILPSVRVPALVLHSRADAIVPVVQGRKLATTIPHAKYIEYDLFPTRSLLELARG